jgi:hypothetical protein
MADLEREDLAAFVHVWSKSLISPSLVTSSTLKVLVVLQELGARGGVLTVPACEEREPSVSDR